MSIRVRDPSYLPSIMLTEYRHDIAEMELSELEHGLESRGRPRFHGRQLFQWIHKRGITDFGEMTDLGRDLRSTLAAEFRTGPRNSSSGSRTAS